MAFRAARIGNDIAVSIERASPAERLDLFRRSAGLTARETELVDLLATGADTRAIAQQMFVSEHTVQDHLKAIFAKTGATSRRDLLARTMAIEVLSSSVVDGRGAGVGVAGGELHVT